MKPLRIFYLIVLIASLSASAGYYYQQKLNSKVLTQLEKTNQASSRTITDVLDRLVQSREKLEKSLQKIDKLDKTIAVLGKKNASFQGGIKALKQERKNLQRDIARLISEKTILENSLVMLERKLSSVEELKQALKIALKTRRIQKQLAKIRMLKHLDEIALREGNRGYLVRNGTPTFGSKARVKVELEPVSKLYPDSAPAQSY